MNNLTPRAQQVMSLAAKAAEKLNHSYVGTEHILIGLLDLGQGVTADIFRNMGIDRQMVRAEIMKTLGSPVLPEDFDTKLQKRVQELVIQELNNQDRPGGFFHR